MTRGAQNSKLFLWTPVVLVSLFCFALEIDLAWRARPGESFVPARSAALSRLSGVRFAIADFDGDWKPDLAVIETASLHRLQANYAVHLQFSAASDVSFLVDAPDGGVRVSARDVNGDNLPDLIVSSVLDEHVVAILLNHGHGQFSREEPASYSGLGTEPDRSLHSCDHCLCDKFTVASLRYSSQGEGVGVDTIAGPVAEDSVVVPEVLLRFLAELHASRGRSPPGNVILS